MEELCALVSVKYVRGRHDEAETVLESSESSEEGLWDKKNRKKNKNKSAQYNDVCSDSGCGASFD